MYPQETESRDLNMYLSYYGHDSIDIGKGGNNQTVPQRING